MRLSSTTVLTLLVAAPLVVLLGILAVPMVNGASSNLERTTQNVAAGLRYTRSRALSNNRVEAFTLDARKREFRLPEVDAGKKIPESIEVAFFSTRERRMPRTFGVIRFFPDGSSTGGRVELSARGDRFLVNVDWLTGKVDVIEAVVDEARGR